MPDRTTPRAGAGSPWRPVAIACAVALGAIGAAAAPGLDLPPLLGALAGALAALLAVMALPSLPPRRVAIVVLGLAGLGALRHAALPSTGSVIIVCWAAATLVALVLVDRADGERLRPLEPEVAPPRRVSESLRVAAVVGAIVVAVSVALVPTVTDELGRRMWRGALPSLEDSRAAPSSLRAAPRLDMTSRPRLSDRVVFTVEAERPDFWRGDVFDQWDGQVWTRAQKSSAVPLRTVGGAYQVPTAAADDAARRGRELEQTFHVETAAMDLLFAAPTAVEVESKDRVAARVDGTAIFGELGKGAVYTVTSRSALPTADDLRATDADDVPNDILELYAKMPAATARVRALAAEITAGATTTYDKVRAIERWLGTHTEYSLDAPLSPRGEDVVDHFLFASRVGWCEQVSSSMAVLARSVGIPARLATGFVPGETDGLSGRFVVRERDAHAWTEIYFPGIGWQGFDPTASVPLAGEAPNTGSWLDTAREHAAPLAIGLAVLVGLAVSAPTLLAQMRSRHQQRASWPSRALRRLDRIGRRAGRIREPTETPREYAAAVATVVGDARVATVGDVIDRDTFGAGGADATDRGAADAILTDLTARRPRHHNSAI